MNTSDHTKSDDPAVLHSELATLRLELEQRDKRIASMEAEYAALQLDKERAERGGDEATLARLKSRRQILWQYVNAHGEATPEANPNGSLDNIAGVCNEAGNVAGLMPHPERASEPILGSDDGRWIFESMIETLRTRAVAKVA